MSHAKWMEALLEADPAELAGEGDTPLAAHVRACDRCRALGRRMLDEHARLAGAMAAIGPRTVAPRAADRRFAEGRLIPGRFRRAAVLAPLAVAAGLAALLLWTPRDGSVRRAAGEAPETGPARVTVDVPAGGAAVFATRDPTVTLVWIETPEGERR